MKLRLIGNGNGNENENEKQPKITKYANGALQANLQLHGHNYLEKRVLPQSENNEITGLRRKKIIDLYQQRFQRPLSSLEREDRSALEQIIFPPQESREKYENDIEFMQAIINCIYHQIFTNKAYDIKRANSIFPIVVTFLNEVMSITQGH